MGTAKLEDLTQYHRNKVLARAKEYWQQHRRQVRRLMSLPPTQAVCGMRPGYVSPIEPSGSALFDCSKWDGHHWRWYTDHYIKNMRGYGQTRFS